MGTSGIGSTDTSNQHAIGEPSESCNLDFYGELRFHGVISFYGEADQPLAVHLWSSPMSQPDHTEEMLRVSEVAARLNVHVSTVYRLADSGRLKAHSLGDGKIRRRGLRIVGSSVDQLLRESVITADAA